MLTTQAPQSNGIEAQCRQGLLHGSAGRHQDAAASYLAAWALLPEPREERSEARWILSAVVGTALAKGCSEQAMALHRAIREAGGAASPGLRLALAEVCLALGLTVRASEELAAAVASGGPGVLRHGGAACRALLPEGTVL
jgi:hypothetical protein